MDGYGRSAARSFIAAALCTAVLAMCTSASFAQPQPSAAGTPEPSLPPAKSATNAPASTPGQNNNSYWVWFRKNLVWLGKNGVLAPVGAIGAAFIGFGGLIWATNRGYRNVINAQKEAADQRRAEHQEQVRFDTQTLALALRGEVTAIKIRCGIHLDVLKKLRDEWGNEVKTNAELAAERISMKPTPQIAATIYQNNAARLGMLGPSTIERVAELYSRLLPDEPAGSDGKVSVRDFMGAVDSWVVSMTLNIELAELVEMQLMIVAATGDLTTVDRAYLAGKEALKAEAETAAKKKSAGQSGAAPATA